MEHELVVPERLAPILVLVCEGKRNRDIAEACFLQLHTVENYVSERLEIFGVPSRTALALAAQRAGIWSP